MNSINLKKGFTLIELLVVVAIIGILASIVLVSLNSARAKGRDASAKGSMSSIRAAAEIYYDTNHSSYNGVCADASIVALLNASDAQTGTATAAQCADSQLDYVAGDTLNNGHFFCVDSAGFAGDFDSAGAPILEAASMAAHQCVSS